MISSNQFGYNHIQKRFIIEVSSIEITKDNDPFEFIYNNGAVDKGICIESLITGHVAKFLVSSIRSKDGVIVSWNLLPTLQTIEQFPNLKDHTLIMFNS